MQKKQLVLLLTATLSLAACVNSSKAVDTQPAQQTVKTVKVNQPFTIALDGNPTTGYQWQLKQLPAQVKLVKQQYQQSQDCQPGMVGCGGKEVFTFQAQQTGKADLVFEYGRPWEKQAGQSRTITVNVQ